ncbi:hypothetical protein [Sansalvadorimonas verongulae]|uniref:hypothetical protein n=1 Tax=Sansalvadorimonas verongulae TaxID=2172824 RepID=UPI0012BD62ED|nr:hypothetical protein [Sansalvadorimonas verongulae]MTI15522.1 hypothetical protein [Sansalvadorimonas verongulae]
MAAADIGRSAQRVFKYYKKHFDDINALFEISGLPPSSTSVNNSLPDDLIALQLKADQSLKELQQHTNSVDELSQIDSKDLQNNKPELCKALVNYRQDLDTLFSAIQTIKAHAPKPLKKSSPKNKRVRTKKF